MQPQSWTKLKLLFATLLAFIGANKFCIGVDVVRAANLDDSSHQHKPSSKYFAYKQQNYQPSQKSQFNANSDLQQSQLLNSAVAENTPSNVIYQPRLIAQSNPVTRPDTEPNLQLQNIPSDTQQLNDAPQLEVQPRDFPQPSPIIREELLNKPSVERTERLQRLRRLLQQTQKQNPPEISGFRELELRVRPRPLPQQKPPLPIQQPVAKFRPIGSLQARVGYFQTSNIFSSAILPREDGLIFYGLSLASAYFPLGSKTYVNGSINGNLIRYMEQSRFNYNQLSFNLGLYQQLSPRMYAELGFNNQQFFYANSTDSFQSGDRFLNENSLRLSLGRREPLNSRLTLDSLYEFSANFAEPTSRSRLINSFWVALNYSVQKPLQVGINYQLNLSDFTQRQRDDQYHRLFGNVIYRMSDSSSLNLQSGISFGDSTERNIDFNSWFLSVYYNLKIGEF
ncbi:hypothetical protein [Fortiea sp. LEGE XX443]